MYEGLAFLYTQDKTVQHGLLNRANEKYAFKRPVCQEEHKILALGEKGIWLANLLNNRAVAAPVGRFDGGCENGCGMYITAQDTWKWHTERMTCTCLVKLDLSQAV